MNKDKWLIFKENNFFNLPKSSSFPNIAYNFPESFYP